MRALSRSLVVVASLAISASVAQPVAAQTSFVFQVQQAASNFTWTGTSTIGPIVGNPSNMFQMTGPATIDMTLQSGTQPFASAAFTGGSVSTVPDIHGRINNPIIFLPPLATIDVTGLVLSPTSPVFSVGGGGAFTASFTVTALAGTLTVAVLGQSPTSSSLANQSSTPTSVAGTLVLNGTTMRMTAPVSTTFPFSDPTSGASGSITLNGTIVADYPLFAAYCFGTGCPCGNNSAPGSGTGCLNSTGVGARIAASGLPIVTNDSLVLTGSNMPATATALYFQGNTQANGGAGAAFGDGLRCVATSIARLGTKTNAGGSSSYPSAGDAPVSIQGFVPAAGATRNYQAWYRNSADFCTVSTFNLSNGLRVTWLP